MSVSLYSNAACTIVKSAYATGSTFYINSSICLDKATTNTAVKIEIFNSSDVLQATALSTTYNFSANVVVTIKTDICSGTAPSWTATSATLGEYYVKLTLSGTGVDTTSDVEWFSIIGKEPVITNQQLSDYDITYIEPTTISCQVANMTSTDELYVEIASKVFLLTTTDYINYARVTYGSEIGVCAAATIKFVAKNAYGAAEEVAPLTLTVTYAASYGTHVIDKLSEVFGHPFLTALRSYTIDSVYGSAISTTYDTEIAISAVILKQGDYYSKRLQQDFGIQTKDTPVILVPEYAPIALGSRVRDHITNVAYEVVTESNVVIHPKLSIKDKISYRQYDLKKVQQLDGHGV